MTGRVLEPWRLRSITPGRQLFCHRYITDEPVSSLVIQFLHCQHLVEHEPARASKATATHVAPLLAIRRGVFTKQILSDLRAMFASLCADFEAKLVEFDGEDNHVHLLVNYPPKVSVSELVNSLKGVSSRMIRKKNYPSIRKKLWGGALWSPRYFAGSCGGAPITVIRKYIEQQQTPF
jgi:putative transposase